MRKIHTHSLASSVFEQLLKSGFNMKIPHYELFVVSLCVLHIHMHKQLPDCASVCDRVRVCAGFAIEIQLLVSLFAAAQKAKKNWRERSKLFASTKKKYS